LSGPLEPAETANRLMALDLPTIRGNHERQLLDFENAPGGATDQFAYENTTAAHRDWLRSLPASLDIDGVLACHGTPASDVVFFLEEVDASGIHLASRADIEARAAGVARSLIVCGHSHIPRAIGISGGRLVVNPGSVGLPAYTGEHPHGTPRRTAARTRATR